ncbi:MAG TPA: hypothetical protein VM578_05340 [Candidatus Saccharimonadales bacterium]|nr:hypothetical protein [Candidatus Saccharimonadales bacterium]
MAILGGALVVSAAAQEGSRKPSAQGEVSSFPPPQSQYPTYAQSQDQNHPSEKSGSPDYPSSADYNASQSQEGYPQAQPQDRGYPPDSQDQGYPAPQSQNQNYPPQSQYPSYPQSQDRNYPPAQDRNYPPQQSEERNYPPQSQYPSSQSQYPPPQGEYPPYPQQPGQYPPAPVQTREWVPQGIGALGQYSTGRTEFTLDHSMLVLATKMDRDNDDLRRVVLGVNGVSVHSFRFPGRVSCDPYVMAMISQEYRDAGFQHLVSKRRRGTGGVGTDLWLRVDHGVVSDIGVLFVGERQLNFVSVSGSISPLELLHLSGHFGIPRMDGGIVVPVPYGNRHSDHDHDGYHYR